MSKRKDGPGRSSLSLVPFRRCSQVCTACIVERKVPAVPAMYPSTAGSGSETKKCAVNTIAIGITKWSACFLVTDVMSMFPGVVERKANKSKRTKTREKRANYTVDHTGLDAKDPPNSCQ